MNNKIKKVLLVLLSVNMLASSSVISSFANKDNIIQPTRLSEKQRNIRSATGSSPRKDTDNSPSTTNKESSSSFSGAEEIDSLSIKGGYSSFSNENFSKLIEQTGKEMENIVDNKKYHLGRTKIMMN